MTALATQFVLGSTTRNVGWVVLAVTIIGVVVYALVSVLRGKDEVGAEMELAPNRKKYVEDEELEGRVLNRNLYLGLGAMVILAVGLPLYWLGEPARNDEWQGTFDRVAASRGEELFGPSAEGGLGCADCHGPEGVGGVAPFVLTDTDGNFVDQVEWQGPALNTVLHRYSEEEVFDVLVYGRPFSPMPAWGTEGGGPLNDQQLTNLIEYMKEFQLDADEVREELDAALEAAMASGDYETEGEALFNLGLSDGFAGGAYSCGRCHTLGWSYGQPAEDGTGAYGPNLTNVENQFPTAELQEEFITIGSDEGQAYGVNGQGSGAMPGFGELFTPEQIAAVVEYERSLGS